MAFDALSKHTDVSVAKYDRFIIRSTGVADP